MHGQINIRKAGIEDVSILTGFNLSMALETENLKLNDKIVSEGVKSLISQPQFGYYLVAEIGVEIAGSLMVTTEWSDWRNGLFWWIQSVYVKPEYRRKGIYRALYNKVKELAGEIDNIRGFRLYVEKNNAAAQKVYRALGMVETHYRLYEEITTP